MELTEEEIVQIYAKQCKHCLRNTLLPYEYELSSVACGYVIKRKHELIEIQRNTRNFILRLKYAEHKNFCTFKNVYKIYEVIDYDKIYEVYPK